MELIVIGIICYLVGKHKGRKAFYDDMLRKEFEEWKKNRVINQQ